MTNIIDNKVKSLKTTDSATFLSWEFNILKDKKRDVTKLKNAIKKHGWSFPIFLWQGHNYIIDGAGRRKAVEEMVKEGFVFNEIPYVEIEAKDLKEAKQKALEASSQFGDITKSSFLEFIGDELGEVDWDTFDVGLTYDSLIKAEDDEDDVAPETPIEPQTKHGDIYEINGHRILCGDSTKSEDMEKLMQGHRADVVFTDPPYNVDYKGTGENTKQGIMNDKMDDEKFEMFLKDVFLQMKGNIKKGSGCYIFHSHKTAGVFEKALKDNHFIIDTQLIWNKPSAGLGANDYRTKHEPFFYCYLDKDHVFYGDRTGTTVWKIPEDEGKALEWFKKQLIKSEEGGGNCVEYEESERKRIRTPNAKTCGITYESTDKLFKERRRGARFIHGLGVNSDSGRETRSKLLWYGIRSEIRRCRDRKISSIYQDKYFN